MTCQIFSLSSGSDRKEQIMVKVLDFNANLKPETICTLFADTSSEVSSDMTIVGLPANMKPAAGSALITAAGPEIRSSRPSSTGS